MCARQREGGGRERERERERKRETERDREREKEEEEKSQIVEKSMRKIINICVGAQENPLDVARFSFVPDLF